MSEPEYLSVTAGCGVQEGKFQTYVCGISSKVALTAALSPKERENSRQLIDEYAAP